MRELLPADKREAIFFKILKIHCVPIRCPVLAPNIRSNDSVVVLPIYKNVLNTIGFIPADGTALILTRGNFSTSSALLCDRCNYQRLHITAFA